MEIMVVNNIMKIYDSKYRYSELDHTEIKRMVYEIFTGLKKDNFDVFYEEYTSVPYFKTNQVEYDIDFIRSDYIKSLIRVVISRTTPIRKSIDSRYGKYGRFFIKVKNLKVKLNWYFKDDLWRLWEDMEM
jgi:hypothetical protein